MRLSFAFGLVVVCAGIAVAGSSHAAGSCRVRASSPCRVRLCAVGDDAQTGAGAALARRRRATPSDRVVRAGRAPSAASSSPPMRHAPAADKDARRAAGKGRPLAIGYGRAIPAAAQVLDGSALSWVALADGSFAARIDVASEGAAAVRLPLAAGAMDPDVSVRFVGSAAGAEVFGPYPINVIADAAARNGALLVAGARRRDGDAGDPSTGRCRRRRRCSSRVTRVSHLAVAGERLRTLSARDVADIGSAGACEIDVACVTPPSPALLDAAAAVAKTLFTGEDGLTLDLFRHAAQRLDHLGHAVFLHGQSLHRLGEGGGDAQHLLVLRRGGVQRACRRHPMCSRPAGRPCSVAATTGTGRWSG